jgi:hypothetical protein
VNAAQRVPTSPGGFFFQQAMHLAQHTRGATPHSHCTKACKRHPLSPEQLCFIIRSATTTSIMSATIDCNRSFSQGLHSLFCSRGCFLLSTLLALVRTGSWQICPHQKVAKRVVAGISRLHGAPESSSPAAFAWYLGLPTLPFYLGVSLAFAAHQLLSWLFGACKCFFKRYHFALFWKKTRGESLCEQGVAYVRLLASGQRALRGGSWGVSTNASKFQHAGCYPPSI